MLSVLACFALSDTIFHLLLVCNATRCDAMHLADALLVYIGENLPFMKVC